MLSDFPELAEEHGYTLEEVEEMKEKYIDDREFLEIAWREVNEQCYESVIKANLTEFTPRSPSYHEED